MSTEIQKRLHALISYFNQKRYEDAIELALDISTHFPSEQLVYKVLGSIYQIHGRLPEATQAMEKAVKLNPSDSEALSNLGVILLESNRLDEAESILREAVKLDVRSPTAHLNLGVGLEKSRRFDAAKDSYVTALELAPNSVQLHLYLGRICHQLKQLQSAKSYCELALKLDPNNASVYNQLGVTFLEIGDFIAAEKCFRKSIAIEPSLASAHANLGTTLKYLNSFDAAENSLNQALSLEPDNPQALEVLGVLLVEMSKFGKAEIILNKGRLISPNSVPILSSLGCVLYSKGDLKSALELFKTGYHLRNGDRIIELRYLALQKRSDRQALSGRLESISNSCPNPLGAADPLIFHRDVEPELVEKLYEMNTRNMDLTRDTRYGNGVCSPDFEFLEIKNSVIKKTKTDLTKIISDNLGRDIYIFDSFFNILRSGGGTLPHDHLATQDSLMDLGKQKYSLVYYLSVGDQDCSKPGVLKLHSPSQEILPENGMIIIIPANRKHSAVYDGRVDRVLIGVNFYVL